MKIHAVALFVLIVAGMGVFFNTTGVMYDHTYEEIDGTNISKVDEGIFEIDTTESLETKESLVDKIPIISELRKLAEVYQTVKDILWMGATFGLVIGGWIGGSIGVAFGIFAQAVLTFVYLWGAIQIILRISTKGMD